MIPRGSLERGKNHNRSTRDSLLRGLMSSESSTKLACDKKMHFEAVKSRVLTHFTLLKDKRTIACIFHTYSIRSNDIQRVFCRGSRAKLVQS